MREFDVNYVDGLRVGLRPFVGGAPNQEQLVECKNAKVSEKGLLAFEPINTINPFNQVMTIDWPFPQLFLGDRYNWVADKNLFWWGSASNLAIATGDYYDFADFGDYIIGTNGATMLYRDTVAETWTSFSSLSTIPGFGTCCAFNGQLIIGNIKSSWHDCGTNSVAWSNIGSADFTVDEKNVAGYRQMPFSGDVLRVLKLGEKPGMVVVYGENGIGILNPVSSPAVTFGFTKVGDIGIPCKSAVGGDEKLHAFVTQAGDLWTIDPEGGLKRRGYNEFMSNLDSTEIVVSFDPDERDFYIADDDYCYLLSEQGLSQVHQSPTSVSRFNGVLYGIFEDDLDAEMLVVTDTLDFGIRGMKTINAMEGGFDGSADFSLSVDYRYDPSGSFTRRGWVLANKEGHSVIKVTAPDLRLAFKASDYTNARLDYLRSKVKISDKRYIRGLYARSSNA